MNLPPSGNGKVLRWAVLEQIYGWYGFICDVMKEKMLWKLTEIPDLQLLLELF